MKEFIITHTSKENAVLVGLITPEQNETKSKEYLDELDFLADTAGIKAVKRFTQRLNVPHSVTFVGTGKLQEIKEYTENEDNEIGMVIFDDELSPKQLRNLEAALKVKIMDRTSLILDIFAGRAQTAHAKTQVELAQYNYMLPRLKRLWTHLERQSGKGSSGFRMRGPGETQLETDRRIILNKISKLKDELKEIDRQKSSQRKNRGKLVRVALVGYTNVGKSTVMNLLSKSNVFAEDKLFATLDTTVRKVTIGNLSFLLSDTVGFIRKLPVELVESFKSTLDEVREADLLVHVVDISHPNFEEQLEVVTQTLNDISAENKPAVIVFNKIDIFSYIRKEEDDLSPKTKENISLEELKNTWMSKLNENAVFISALDKKNIEEFKTLLYEKVREIHVQRFPYNDFLYQDYDQLIVES
ncbi:MAG: GTPase HflX [Dysgonamonadaceae bacterium]|jgi:GTP-binding protein HflX|nr:GTPase HflX [Dysgonamonadaceae bacterium]